ncbi:hypothetical protein ANN_00876 [Periplaneta americana]|uniref:DDE-1 domain-containing protein n=1 Tax=Periplaneta americana TaxID=6978 RepID=A0ABQ8TUW3_PERAM|nr:hypothetical protein ANN_00876 [Periplaneta americana]
MVPFIRLCDDRIISRNLWPPRSPDLTTPDNICYRGKYISAEGSLERKCTRKENVLSSADLTYQLLNNAGVQGNVLLIFDGASSHLDTGVVDVADSCGITLFCLPSNTTHDLQPFDKSVFGPYEAFWDDEVLLYWSKQKGAESRTVNKRIFGKILIRVGQEQLHLPMYQVGLALLEFIRSTLVLSLRVPSVLRNSPGEKRLKKPHYNHNLDPNCSYISQISDNERKFETSFQDILCTPEIKKKHTNQRRKALNCQAVEVIKEFFQDKQETKSVKTGKGHGPTEDRESDKNGATAPKGLSVKTAQKRKICPVPSVKDVLEAGPSGIQTKRVRKENGLTHNQIHHILIDKRRHTSIVDIRTFRGADFNCGHYLVIGELRERLSVAKRVEQQVNITKFNILKLKDEEPKQNYQVEISNRFATLESSDEVEKELDVNSVWENIRDSIKIAPEQSIGYYETEKKKPWFDEDCCMVVQRRKQATLKFLQDPVEEKRDNYFNERREARRTLRNEKRGYLKEKLNEVETNSKNKNIRDLYKGIKEFKNGYQPRVNVIKDENGDLLADSPSILNRWKNYFAQLLNVHRPNRNDRDEIEIQTAEPFIPEPTLPEVEIAIEDLKKYKSPGIDQIPAELIQEGGSALYSEIYKLVLAIWERKLYQNNGRRNLQEGDKTNCTNFRGISLLLMSYKMLSNILLRRLTPYVDEIIGDHQCGFRRNRSTIDQIFCIRQIMEKKWEYKEPVTSNIRSEFNIDPCRSLICADIPLYNLKNGCFRNHTSPDESTKTYAPSIYHVTVQKIRDEIKMVQFGFPSMRLPTKKNSSCGGSGKGQLPKVDLLMSSVKIDFLKAPSRVNMLREMYPEIPLSPKPILTKWGTWLEAVEYYSEHSIKNVLLALDSEDTISIDTAKTVACDTSVKNDLTLPDERKATDAAEEVVLEKNKKKKKMCFVPPKLKRKKIFLLQGPKSNLPPMLKKSVQDLR